MSSPEGNPREFVNSYETPVLLMQAEPRQVVTANRQACELFGKNLSLIAGFRGGQVFDCIHSFSEAGCGKDPNCEGCKIKDAVVDTFATGRSHPGVRTILNIKKHDEIFPCELQVSTERFGDFALLTIRNYTKKDMGQDGSWLS